MFTDFFDAPTGDNKKEKEGNEQEDIVVKGEEIDEADEDDVNKIKDENQEKYEEEEDDEEGKQEEEEDEESKSKFERKQKLMQDKIAKLEDANLSEKPWQLGGETNSRKRPMNSLLEEFMAFDHTSVGAPAITEETPLSLEDLIKQRVKDQAWDDVLRKDKPIVQPYEYKKSSRVQPGEKQDQLSRCLR